MEQAVERGASRSVQFCSRRADGGASKGAPSAEHFLADGNADAFLKFEAHQRNVTVERIRGGLRISLAKLSDLFDQHFGKGEPGHGAGSTGHQFFQEESAAQAPENAEINSFGRFQNADSLQRGGRVLEFDGARPGDLASDTHQQRRLHGETGNRGIILHDDFDVHRGSHGGEVGDNGFRIELEHARGAYHHAGSASGASHGGELHAGTHAVRGRSGNNGNSSVDFGNDGFEDQRAFAFVQTRGFAGDTESGKAVDAGGKIEIDDAAETVEVNIAVFLERRRQHRKNTLKWHGVLLKGFLNVRFAANFKQRSKSRSQRKAAEDRA